MQEISDDNEDDRGEKTTRKRKALRYEIL